MLSGCGGQRRRSPAWHPVYCPLGPTSGLLILLLPSEHSLEVFDFFQGPTECVTHIFPFSGFCGLLMQLACFLRSTSYQVFPRGTSGQDRPPRSATSLCRCTRARRSRGRALAGSGMHLQVPIWVVISPGRWEVVSSRAGLCRGEAERSSSVEPFPLEAGGGSAPLAPP